jgi:hypothetical protein
VVSAEQHHIVPVTIFEDRLDNQPRPYRVSWLALAQRLCTYDERSSKDGRAWSPVSYRPGTTRGKANVDQVYMLVLDVDHTALPLDLLEGLEYVAHTTYSHTPDDPRWRVVLPLAEPIDGSDWPMFWLRANAHFGGCVDPATKDSSRIFYLPSCQPGGVHEVRRQHGAFLEPSSLPEVPRYEPAVQVRRSIARTDSYLRGWAERFAETKAAELSTMGKDTGRNAACNRAAFLLGGLIADPLHGLDTTWVANALYGACARNGLVADDGQRQVEATIRSGIEAGLMRPWSPADQEGGDPHTTASQRVHVPNVQHEAAHETRPGPQIWTGPQLAAMAFDAPRWAIPDLLPAGLAILAGRPKLGKSWLGLGWALDIPRPSPALRRLKVVQGETLYLALEDGPRRMQERMALMLGDTPAPQGFNVVTEWPRTNEGGLELLDQWLTEHTNARMVVIDTFKRVRPVEKNSQRLYDLDYDAMQPLAELARRHNVAIVVVFHTRKGESTDPLEMVSGTLGLSGAADCVLVLRRERGQIDASLFVTGRDVEEQDLALRWEKEDMLGWALLGNADEFRRSKERQLLVDAVKTMPGLKPVELADATGKSRGSVRYLLFRLVQDGELRVRDGGYYPGLLVATQATANSFSGTTNSFGPSELPSHVQNAPSGISRDESLTTPPNTPNSPTTPAPLTTNGAVSTDSTVSPNRAVRGVSGIDRRVCRWCGRTMPHPPDYVCPRPEDRDV